MNHYDRYCTVAIDSVRPLIGTSSERIPIAGIPVKVSSLRLRTFKRSIHCISCGLKALYFAIERDKYLAMQDGPYHLNLYGVTKSGKEVLFTHDHRLARSLGGKNDLSNTDTMCTKCNHAKSIKEQKILESRLAQE